MSPRLFIYLAPHLLLVAAILLPAGPALFALALWVLFMTTMMIGLLRPRSTMFGANYWHAPAQPKVALTFDDGPHPDDTPAILEILQRAGVRATFFMIGSRARAHPALVRQVARAGHETGVHSDTHPWWFSLAGPERLRREVRVAAGTLQELADRPQRFFRPPMGHKNFFLPVELEAAHLEMTTWSARSYDTLGRAPEKIRDLILARATPGGIILLHEGVRREAGRPSPTVRALPAIIEGLRARHLEPVSLGDLRQGSAGQQESRSPADPPS